MKNEWRVPLTLLMFSSLVFTGVTLMFGVSVNRYTGETEYDMMMALKDDDYKDPWVYDPMAIVWGDYWRYWCIAGYYSSLAIFSFAWFEYMKWEKENRCRKSGKDET